MGEQTVQETKKPLRIIDPQLYRLIVNELNERHNIHSYDIEILAIEEKSGLKITLLYGENYANATDAFFSLETLKNQDDELTTFIHEVADDCKKVMVAEYFKMMKP